MLMHNLLLLFFGASTGVYTNRCACTHRGTHSYTLTDTHICSLGELFVKIAAMNPFPVFTFFVISLLYIDLRFNPCD